MRLATVILTAAVFGAGAASAQVCTTTTTVVSRDGDLVSSTTATRCEATAAPAAATGTRCWRFRSAGHR